MPFEQTKKSEPVTAKPAAKDAAAKPKTASTLEDRGFTMNTGVKGPPDLSKNPMYTSQLDKSAPKPDSQKVGGFEIVSDKGKYLSENDFNAATEASWVGSKMDDAMLEKWISTVEQMLELANKMQALDLRAALGRLKQDREWKKAKTS